MYSAPAPLMPATVHSAMVNAHRAFHAAFACTSFLGYQPEDDKTVSVQDLRHE